MSANWRNKSRINERMKAEFHDRARERAESSLLFRDLRKLDEEPVSDQVSLEVRWQTYISQAGLMWSLPQLLIGCVLSAFILVSRLDSHRDTRGAHFRVTPTYTRP